MSNSDKGMFNVNVCESKVNIGDGKGLAVLKVGSLKMTFSSKEGLQTFTLKNVKYVPDLCVNLLSIPVALKDGFNIGNEGMYLFLQKGNFHLKFNKLFTTGSSSICGIDLYPMTPEYAAPALEEGSKIILQDAHSILGHCGEDST